MELKFFIWLTCNMDRKQALEEKLTELEIKIRETEKRLPAHSVKPQIMTELFELEDEYEAVSSQLKALKRN
jgi:hypothetical protein